MNACIKKTPLKVGALVEQFIRMFNILGIVMFHQIQVVADSTLKCNFCERI